VSLAVFTPEGKLVRTLVDEALPAGLKEFVWDGRNNAGNPVGSGVYLYRLQAGHEVVTKKMVLIK
ncbi:MAG: FlgD immunoglobulin-like domain containing protein, partial [Candidatus Latescibacterota bacterium]